MKRSAMDLMFRTWAAFYAREGRHPRRIYAGPEVLTRYDRELQSLSGDIMFPWSSSKIDSEGHLLFRGVPLFLCARGYVGAAG